MKTNWVFLIVALVVLLLISGCTQSEADYTVDESDTQTDAENTDGQTPPPALDDDTPPTPPSNDNTPPIPPEDLQPTYTLEEVAEHSTETDCWMVLDGKVYAVTEFISSHPGGIAILEGCGKDATTLFETRPMGSGTPHSSGARTRSEPLYIGDLAE